MSARSVIIRAALVLLIAWPMIAAAMSPLLAWRSSVYIVAGFAGVFAMGLLLLQPLLAGGYLPGISALKSRRLHRLSGLVLILAIIAHVGGLWLTSPPDMIDALLFRAPTYFSLWGVIAMWASFAAAALMLFQRRLSPRFRRAGHSILVAIVVLSGAAHALLIDGTMEPVSKGILCIAVIAATLKTLYDKRVWRIFR